MIYVLSNIHGHEGRFDSVLRQIDLQPDDILYILGDVIDRHPDGIRILRRVMRQSNIKMLLGNHEYMMLQALYHEINNVQQDSRLLRLWYRNGGKVTHDYLKHIRKSIRSEIFSFLDSLPVNTSVEVNGRKYLLTHAAPTDLFPQYSRKYADEKEFAVWWRHITEVPPNDNYTVIFGHTGTYHFQTDDPLRIWHGDHIIGIDCGSAFPEGGDPWSGMIGRLGCLRFSHLPYDQEDLEKILPHCVWQPIEIVRLQSKGEL